jgi:hypothetical protein
LISTVLNISIDKVNNYKPSIPKISFLILPTRGIDKENSVLLKEELKVLKLDLESIISADRLGSVLGTDIISP